MNPRLSAFLSSRMIDRRDGHRARVLSALAEKTRINALAQDGIENHRREKLAALLRHAREKIPFYATLLPEPRGICAGNSLELLRTLPVVTRTHIQQNSDSFRDATAPVSIADATGGSTGTPMRFFVDRETQIARESSLMWADSLAGWSCGERIAMLWGSDRDVRGAMSKWKSTLRWVVENRRWFNAFDMGPERMAEFHSAMERFSPHLIVAYSGSAFLYARFLRQRGIRPSYPLRALVCSAEICAPEMRREIEDVFGRPVFDRYGSREFGAIAAENESHGGLLLNHADFIVEIGAPVNGNSTGPLIVTYLHNRAMPFLRYDTGDLSSFQTASTLRPVQGRRSDTIRTADGKMIHGEFFTHLLYGCPDVSQFQFVQETQDDYRLVVVARRDAAGTMEIKWRRDILEAVGPASRLTIEYRDTIPPLASGKHKFTVSMIGEPAGAELGAN